MELEASLIARPLSEYELEKFKETPELYPNFKGIWKYHLEQKGSYRMKGEIVIDTVILDVPMPEVSDVDMLRKAIETLEDNKKTAYQNYMTECQEIDAQIKAMKMLAHIQDPPEVEGHLIEGEVLGHD